MTLDRHYRPDVDGLRAVAVLLVVLFHAGLGCPGGFVGVDVFFVISGYLITGLILRQQRAGTFRLADFWGRRIRRIVPAACVVVFCTLLAGSLLLFPIDIDELAWSAMAQQLMLSNVFFWRYTAYFAGPADLKPLLHTWSLAVEEQFYLAYPFLLVLLGRWRPRAVAGLLGAAALASLALSEWGSHVHPSATFYLLPTRAWELLLGGLLCFVPALAPGRRVLAECLGLAGLVLIVGAALRLDTSTRFPGLAALPPCLGAALIIYASAGQPGMVGRLLSWRPVVLLGLMSYSLYLWHWPLFAFARYLLGEQLPIRATAAIIGGSLALAWLSWRFVETPFRRSLAWASPRPVLIGLVATMPALLICALVAVGTRGTVGRPAVPGSRYLAARNSKAHIHEIDARRVRHRDLPSFGDRQGRLRCLVWGDSHAMAIVPGVDAACQSRGVRGIQATHSSTAPVLEFFQFARFGLNEEAPAFNRAVVDYAVANDIDVAILSGVWSNYGREPAFERRLRQTIDELRAAGIAVAIVLDVAHHADEAPLQLARREYFQWPTHEVGVPLAAHRSRNAPSSAAIARAAYGRAVVLDPAPWFVDDRGLWRAELDGEVLYRDKAHLSIEGGLRLRPLFEQLFDSLATGPEAIQATATRSGEIRQK
jgi:peptidoglycan/LPS O-acetylase OafA/YrhL